MVAETIKKTYNYEKFPFTTDECQHLFDYVDEDLENAKKDSNTLSSNQRATSGGSPERELKKPKSILVNHENENVTKKSKPHRIVSFTLDDTKKPFTSSIYYGVKSYLHHFYEPVNKTVNEYENSSEDDFEFVVEPGRRRKNCWFYIGLCSGLGLLLIAMLIILIGNLTPLRNPVVAVKNNLEILDQKAITFNQRIELCQYFGLIVFCLGSIVVMVTLLVSAYEEECGCHNLRNQILYPSFSDTNNAWIRYAEYSMVPYDNRIPLSQEIKAVQQVEPTKE